MCDKNQDHPNDSRCVEKEMETLRILLVHWIEHTNSHEANFREWAQRSKEFGKDKVSEMIYKASDSLKAASAYLFEAKKHM